MIERLPELSAPVPDALSTVRNRIVDIARAASFEVAARDGKAIDAVLARLDPGTQVSITWLPQDDDDARVAAARRLHEGGFTPIPHIAARMVHSEAHLRQLTSRLADTGVEQLLVISGDIKQATGPFNDSAALIDSPAFGHPALRHIWVGGYPEGHPAIDSARLVGTLDAKIAAITAQGMTAGVITQFCFDSAPILGWMEDFRGRHESVKMRIGLAGPAGIRTLMRYAALCGVGASAKIIASRGASIARLLTEAAPDPIIRDLAATARFQQLQPMGIHLFPFGGLDRTARWIEAVAAGDFDFNKSELGFRILERT